MYDVLRALTDAGLVRRIQPSGSVARYEARVGDNHHHVVCRSCGTIADVDCAIGTAPCLTMSDDHGFSVDEAEVIYGAVPRVLRHHLLITTAITGRKHMSETSNPPTHGSESENPAIDTPTPTSSRPRTVQDWWPNQLDLQVLKKHSATTDPMGRTSTTRASSRSSTSRRSSATSSR